MSISAMDSTGLDTAPPIITDDHLIRRFVQDGDKGSFEMLVRRHIPGIRKVLYAVLNGNRDDMLDAEQEILIGLYKNLHKFSFKSTFRTWLYTFTRNRAVDHLRKLGRQRRIALKLASAGTERIEDPETRALDSVEDSRAVRALESLREEHRIIVIMKDIEDLSIAEIATITGIAPGTVKSRLHRARLKIAKIMEGGPHDQL